MIRPPVRHRAGIGAALALLLLIGTGGVSMLGLQLACTAFVLVSCGVVLVKGLRSGIERASRWIMPTLLAIVLLLVVRSLTLPGARCPGQRTIIGMWMPAS